MYLYWYIDLLFVTTYILFFLQDTIKKDTCKTINKLKKKTDWEPFWLLNFWFTTKFDWADLSLSKSPPPHIHETCWKFGTGIVMPNATMILKELIKWRYTGMAKVKMTLSLFNLKRFPLRSAKIKRSLNKIH